MAGHQDLVLLQRQLFARGDPELPLHQVEASDHLGDRVLHLQAGVHFHEPDAVTAQALGGVSDELDGAGTDVTHSLGRFDGGGGDGFAGGRVHAGGRRLLDHLLVAALQGTVALEQVDDIAVAVAEHLHLDVARAGDPGLQQHPVVAEAGGGFAFAGGQGGGEGVGAVH